MAEQPIKHSEIIEAGDPFEQASQGVKEFIKYLDKLEAALKGGVSKTIKDLQKANAATKKGREEIAKASPVIDEYGKKLKAVNTLKQKAIQVDNDLLKSEVRLKEAARERLKTLKDEVKAEGLAANSVVRMRMKLSQLTKEYDRADAAMRKKLIPRIQNYQKHIQKAEQATGRFQRQVGNYKKGFANAGQSLKSFAMGMVGFTAILSAGIRLMRNAITTILDFDQAMADVGAISRATAEEMAMLRESAKALGGSTKFTATQVAGLQKNLAKLGFTTEEILKSTNAILGLAAATGEDLSKSAEVAGSVLRAFNLDATQMTRVVDTMTAAFSGSALDLEKFSVSMRSVGPVANAFGFSIEETTAFLGTLTNAGFDASMAGTALRNILLNLANTNGALAQELGGTVNTFDEFIPALIKLREKGADLNTTLELTDKRSVAAFNRFLQGAEFTREFREELEKAQGSADEMSKKQLDTLKGDLTILVSAWQGLTIGVRDNTDANDTARGGVRLLTKGLQELTPKQEENRTWWDKLRKSIFSYNLQQLPVIGNLFKLISLTKRFKGEQEDLNPVIEEASERETEMAIQIERVNRARAKAEILEQEEIKNQEKLLQLAKDRKVELEKEADLQNILDEQFKRAFEDKKEIADEEIDWLTLPDETEEEQKADNILKIHQQVTNQSIAAAEQEKQETIQNEQEAAQFRQASMQQGLAGLDKFAQERGVILNASLLADQVRGLAGTIIALTQGTANTAKVGFPQNIPLLIGFAGQVAGLVSTLSSIKVGTSKYAEGGHGELGSEGTVLSGKRHAQGGVNLGEIGEAERGEHFGIINRQMTQKYRSDLPEVFSTLNKGTFHNVFQKSNRLHTSVSQKQDPFTKKMYQLMMKQANVYQDSDGNQVLEYMGGHKRVIKN